MRARGLMAGTMAVVALAAGACGGGDDAGATRAELAAAVNPLCASREARIDELSDSLGDEEGTRQVITINEDLLEKVSEVEVPDDDTEAFERLVSLIRDQNATLQEYADALAAGDAPDETAVVDELEAQAEEFDAGAAALGLDECTAAAGTDDPAPSEEEPAAPVGGPSLDEVAQTFIDYMDAYWKGDAAAELELTTDWAGVMAGFDATAELSPAGSIEPVEANVQLELTGIEEVADGYAVVGDITVTTADTTYDYTDLLMVDDPEKGLVVADYCRTSPDGYGPLQGCVSDAVGYVDGDFTADDGSFRLTMGPILRSLGMGTQYVDFALCLDSVTTPVSIRGGLYTSFTVGTDINGLSGPGLVLAPAELGERSCGYLEMTPPTSATDRSFPSGTLSLQVEKGDGTIVELEVTTPALPQPASAL